MKSVSVSGKKWIIKNFDPEDVNYIKDNYYLDEIISKLIVTKKIKKEDIKNFLHPVIKNNLPNPSVLKDMEKATNRTIAAISNKEKIGIFGDYDVDGASSTALLGKYFSEINHEFIIYIPDRRTEGYGPSKKGFDHLIDGGAKLIFTVDCGTLSFDQVDYANKKKIDTLILDHHQSEIKLPKAHSIINPNRLDDVSNLNYLCAAGVCFMFLVSLSRELRKSKFFSNRKEPNLIDYLDLVTLGTICDVVPLVGLNRALVKQGLKIIKLKKNLGLKTLIDICNIETHPTPYHLGYVLGPRINAGGRVGKCSHGANLLLNIDSKKAFKLASELDVFNKERQILEKNLLNNVIKSIESLSDPVLILKGDNWHEGIIGIIASRIKEKYNKPAIIISISKNIGKASARSITGFDIGSVIISAVQKGLLIKGGGHKMAAGFTIDLKKINEFKNFVLKKYEKQKNIAHEDRKILIDSVISPSALNLDFFNKINVLAPFGAGNTEPKFVIENVKIINSKIVGEKHIKSVLLGGDASTLKTIAFNALDNEIGAYLLKKNNKTFNIVGKLSLNEWKGQKNVEFIIDDISVNKNN